MEPMGTLQELLLVPGGNQGGVNARLWLRMWELKVSGRKASTGGESERTETPC